ncbi:MAG: site-2 protease family protein [Candidatus Viridilinea halotolerans]|uniref:Zinc metalloprotease n=1 Tax=Candidatus Viridilinea halotolerans TaxID=2491704 RepID=A0A426U9P7_9CHLR|nr:MAG: site-2 protease family protein [Candidatus Viridilinea halotolerans]
MFRHTLTIVRIATIPIRLHWSWGVVFGLLVLTMQPVYALYACGTASFCGAGWGLALLMALLIGLAIVLHELGHALVALRMLVPVHSITLFAFGGVAEVERDAPNPRAELLIALAGPAVSFGLALAGGALWWGYGGGAAVAPVAVLAAHFALANGVMATFNLLPGYPMDGGRVLRAALWFMAGDALLATRRAAQVGKFFGWALALGGLVVAWLTQQPFTALWMALIGLFLYRTASASHRQTRLQMALRGVTVHDLMQHHVRTVGRELTLEQFVARYMLGQAELGFAVVETAPDSTHSQLLGMLTINDLRRFKTNQWASCLVGEAMTPRSKVDTLTPVMEAYDALGVLSVAPAGMLPVLEGERLVGMLQRRDVAVFVQVQLAMR